MMPSFAAAAAGAQPAAAYDAKYSQQGGSYDTTIRNYTQGGGHQQEQWPMLLIMSTPEPSYSMMCTAKRSSVTWLRTTPVTQ